jgi:hypothetical protein
VFRVGEAQAISAVSFRVSHTRCAFSRDYPWCRSIIWQMRKKLCAWRRKVKTNLTLCPEHVHQRHPRRHTLHPIVVSNRSCTLQAHSATAAARRPVRNNFSHSRAHRTCFCRRGDVDAQTRAPRDVAAEDEDRPRRAQGKGESKAVGRYGPARLVGRGGHSVKIAIEK